MKSNRIVTLSVIRNWPVRSVIELFKTLSSYTETSSNALNVSDIYLLVLSQAQLRDAHLFYAIKPNDYIEWLTFTHSGELSDTKVKFIAWADLMRKDIEEKCQILQLDVQTITLDDYWKAINLDKYKKQLMTLIVGVESIPIQHAQKLAEQKKIEEDRQRLIEEAEKNKLEVAKFNHAKSLVDQEEKKKRETEWIQENINYYHRCQRYIKWGFYDPDISRDQSEIDVNTDIDIEEIKKTIQQAHILKNKSLLKYKKFPGCHDFGVGCDCDQNCYWMAHMHRCSCDNYKGFSFETDDVDWLKDMTLDSTNPIGRQERQW